MRPTTRPISCLTLRSRSGVPTWPRKYFDTTTLVASCDQLFGISTSVCSKIASPLSLLILAERSSHSTASNGSAPARVKCRSIARPFAFRPGARTSGRQVPPVDRTAFGTLASLVASLTGTSWKIEKRDRGDDGRQACRPARRPLRPAPDARGRSGEPRGPSWPLARPPAEPEEAWKSKSNRNEGSETGTRLGSSRDRAHEDSGDEEAPRLTSEPPSPRQVLLPT